MKMKWKNALASAVVLLVIIYIYYLLKRQSHVIEQSAVYQRKKSRVTSTQRTPVNLSRADEHCNHPYNMFTGLEGSNIPADYHLEQVQILIRHGDRSSMHVLHDQPGYELHCDLTTSGSSMLARKYVTYLRQLSHLRPRSFFWHIPLYPSLKHCPPAQLTPIGVEQHLALGKYLNKIYIKKLGLLQDKFNPNEIHIMSTKYNRTYQSGLAFLYGFLPTFKINRLVFTATNPSFCNPDSHSCKCPIYYDNFMKIFEHLLSVYGDPLQELFSRHLKMVYPSSTVTDVRLRVDSVMAPYCHKQKICVNCDEKTVLEKLWYIEDEIAGRILTNPSVVKLLRLYTQPFLHEIAMKMKNVSLNSGRKFVLYSGHDTSIKTILTALGVKCKKWPPYASRLIFELYSKTEKESKTFHFRLIYNGKEVTSEIRFCHGFRMCPLEIFLQFVQGQNWQEYGSLTYEEACMGRMNFQDL